MPEFMALLLALNLLAFIAALLVGAGVSAAVRRVRHRAPLAPPRGSALRIRAERAVYRTRFLGEVVTGWEFAAPLQRDAYVPLRVGERLVVEAETRHGRMLFRSEVLSRDPETGSMILARPEKSYVLPARGVAFCEIPAPVQEDPPPPFDGSGRSAFRLR